MGSDKIIVKNLKLFGRHGLFPQEKEGQHFLIDFEMVEDVKAAAKTDRIDDALDYHRAIEEVSAVVEGESYNLLETLAEEIAGVLLSRFRTEKVKVRVKKIETPLTRAVEWVAVEIERKANG
jgi:dihydroneopterin aldolase